VTAKKRMLALEGIDAEPQQAFQQSFAF